MGFLGREKKEEEEFWCMRQTRRVTEEAGWVACGIAWIDRNGLISVLRAT